MEEGVAVLTNVSSIIAFILNHVDPMTHMQTNPVFELINSCFSIPDHHLNPLSSLSWKG